MSNKAQLKEAYEVESKHGAFYTGGNVEWHEDTLYCQTSANVVLLNVDTGLIDKSIGDDASDEDADHVQTFTSDGVRLVTSHRSGLLKLWNCNGEVEKTWKYIHKGPVAKLSIKGDRLISGGADGTVRVWDLHYQACTSNLRGCQGVVNVAEFHSVEDEILASGDDGKINRYSLGSNGELTMVYEAHYSKVTALVFAGEHFVTCGRDKVIILWDFSKASPLKTIPTYEAVEVISPLPAKFKLPGFTSQRDCIYVASGGERGVVRVWDVTNVKEVFVQEESLITPAGDGGLAIALIRCDVKSKNLAVVAADHNIIVHHLKSFACIKQFVGFADEILDIAFVGKDDAYLAIATNSNDIKLYDNSTMNCHILKGHSDIVLSLSSSKTNPDLMLSSSKDNSIRLWILEGSTMTCIGVGSRHTASVGSVVFSESSDKFAVSVGQDTCVKVWEIPKGDASKTVSGLYCLRTEIAHQKEINSVAVSPNDKFIATASQDKTVKLWTDTLGSVGVLRGHRRGVWCVRFSPSDQVLLTSSADCTIKLWSVANLSCLKTLEGHDASVLRAEFLSTGYQILSCGADGLIKLYEIKTSECTATFEQHEARIWALALRRDDTGFVTGGADSLLIKWKDVTEELRLKRIQEAEEKALQDQRLSNYLQSEQYLKALKLALRLDRPKQTLKIVESIISKGAGGIEATIAGLSDDQKENLLRNAVSWNMNSRNCQAAQTVIRVLLGELQAGEFRPIGLSAALEGALPYTERHFKRLTQLMANVRLINFTVNCMKPHSSLD